MENKSSGEAFLPKEEIKPFLCKKCGKMLTYNGLGEYRCDNCGAIEYDDYGIVRNYLETHPGANILAIEKATNVPRHRITEMVEDHRFSITHGSSSIQ